MFGLGVPEIAIILVIAVLLFGSSKLPQLGRGLGEAISGFKKAVSSDESKSGKKEDRDRSGSERIIT